jgi:hypothetical protein
VMENSVSVMEKRRCPTTTEDRITLGMPIPPEHRFPWFVRTPSQP